VADSVVALSDKVRILGVTLDSHLTMDCYVNEICRSAFCHIRAIKHIRSAITEDVAETIAASFVNTRLDYANSLLYGTSAKNINRLQRLQNALARAFLGPSASNFTSLEMLRYLHWLPIEYRIKFKIARLAFNSQHSMMPSYLNCLVHHRAQTRCLRYNANKLTVPPFKLDFGSRGFRVATPTVWNALPDYILACTSPSLFSRELKTFYTCSAFKTI
jgi:hypothetical protein